MIFSFVRLFNDDVDLMRVEGGTIAGYWQKAVDMYETWASRVLVNFVVFIFTGSKYLFLWGIFMGLSLYVLMYALSELFTSGKNEKCNMLIACLVLLFPFQYMSSAGWITTMATYLSPTAFGFLSLIPIKRVLDQKKMRWWEYVLYPAALIYGANQEQMMIVVLGCYAAAVIYFLLRKRVSVFLFVQLALSIASLLLVLLCPGNYVRKETEVRWFRSWGMLNAIDRLDLGYSTTMQWLFFRSHIFIIVICLLMTFLIWKKYQRMEAAATAGIPAALIILFGPLNPIVITMFPGISVLTEDIERNGLVTVANRGDFKALCRYFVWAALLIMLCVAMILLQDSVRMLVTCAVLIGTGTLSRLIMGFSPTIHASRDRTFTPMAFCLIAAACYIYSYNLERGHIDESSSRKIDLTARMLIICSLIHIAFLVV